MRVHMVALVLGSLCGVSLAEGEAALADRQAAHGYVRAIIGLSELRDVADQVDRLHLYLRCVGAAGATDALARLDRQIGELSALLQTSSPAPAYGDIDYAAIEAELAKAMRLAVQSREGARHRLAARFPWFQAQAPADRGAVLQSTHKEALAQRFIVFPLLLSGERDYYGGHEDWQLLRILGFEAVCPWVGNWLYRRPAPGATVDDIIAEGLTRLDALIARNAAEGLKTSVWVEPEDIVWALEGQVGPGVFLQAADGTRYQRSRIHNSVNIWHPEVAAQLERFMTALGEHLSDSPDVLCYELFEEPALVLSNPKPKPGEALSHKPAGYSEQAREQFRSYLRDRYGTVEALNASWQADWKSLDDVRPPDKLSGPDVNANRLYDFCRFRTESHAEFFARLVRALQKADPNHAVVPQYLPMFYGNRSSGNDPFLMASAGWDFYSTHDWPGQGPAWETAMTYSAAHWAGKPQWNEEYIWSNWVRREQGEEALWAGARRGLWRQFAWGKRCLQLFSWERGWESPFEGDWNNELLNRKVGLAIPRYAVGVIPGLARKLDRLAGFVYGTELVHDGLGMLVPTRTLLASPSEHSVIWWAQKMTRALLERHHKPLFFPEEMILDGRADLSRFRVILVPPCPLLPEAVAQGLMQWTRAGGTLVWVHEMASFDEYLEGKSSAFRSGVKETPMGQGRLVRIDQNAFNLTNELLDEVILREYPTRAVYSPSRDVELVLRRAEAGHLILLVSNLDVYRSADTHIRVRGRWPRVTDLSVEHSAPVPVSHDGDSTNLLVRTAPGEGMLLRFTH